MLKLKRVSSEACKELIVGNNSILFSYETPVAIHIQGDGFYVREAYNKYSPTTTRHISQFVTGAKRLLNEGCFSEQVNKIMKAYV